MQHRHLTHEQYTLAAIDDIIARGKRRDWAEPCARPRWQIEPCSIRCCASARRTWPIRMRNAITSGSNMPNDTLPEWEQVTTPSALRRWPYCCPTLPAKVRWM
ncbi:MAG: hypothetical protein V9H69_19750 [Anaerolineae bacterium]